MLRTDIPGSFLARQSFTLSFHASILQGAIYRIVTSHSHEGYCIERVPRRAGLSPRPP